MSLVLFLVWLYLIFFINATTGILVVHSVVEKVFARTIYRITKNGKPEKNVESLLYTLSVFIFPKWL